MSLIQDFENGAAHIAKDVLAVDKAAAAFVYGAVKKAGLAGEEAVLAQIPGLVAKAKGYASQEVGSIAQDPAFKNAVGHWQFGVACARVMALLQSEFPVVEKVGGKALQGLIETAVQAAFMGLVTGLI